MANTKKKNTGEVDRFTTNGHGVKLTSKLTAKDKAIAKKINEELAKKKKK